ncbi:protein rep, partial [Staphylococcus aureus]|uniref:protein rep n=1 Tax=Staphylococcus aureus TaxID=1280 RepID=UPI00044E1798
MQYNTTRSITENQDNKTLKDMPTDEGYLKLHKTWFCKSKLCPVCNWRRAMKN